MIVLHSLLAKAISSGNGSDKNAFWTACYNEYRRGLAQKLRAHFKQLTDQASSDFVQDAFEKLWKEDVSSLEKYFKEGDKIEGLLSVTTKRLYLNHLKCAKNTQAASLEGEHTISLRADELPNNGDMARLLGQMSESDMRILQLAWDGYEQQEIADMEGIKLSAMKMRLKRAREKLQTAYLADS